jgi:hypothetical protein
MFIHYHFRRRARSRVLNAAGNKPLLVRMPENIFRVTQTNLLHLFLENMTSLVVQVVGKGVTTNS